jgi:uncharacterized protein (TIGR02996 family)
MARDDESRAFLEAMCEAPEDDTPRLIYADWLDDHGDSARAEFVRVQCELAKLSPRDERRPGLERREAQLLGPNREAWLGPLAKAIEQYDHCDFHRGFPEKVIMRPRAVVKYAEELNRRVPAAPSGAVWQFRRAGV